MAIIQKHASTGRLIPVAFKLPEPIHQLLQQYSRFIESPQVHVIVESLKLTFRDPEFQAWVRTNPPLPKTQLEPKAHKAEVIATQPGSATATSIAPSTTSKTNDKR